MGDLASSANHHAIGQRLAKDEIHVWNLKPEPEADLAEYSRLLGPDERERAGRFRLPHLTHDYTVDHGRMRLILSGYAGLAPEDIVFSMNKFGKPGLANPEAADQAGRLRFNLSHTEGHTLLAICLDATIGVDVERVRAMNDWPAIAQSHFSPLEIAALYDTIDSDRQDAFYRCWTRKEAFLKAHGLGLSIPLDSFAVSLTPEEFPALLSCAWDHEEIGRWSFFALNPGPDFVGALAIQKGDWQLCSFSWEMYSSGERQKQHFK